MRFYIKLLIMLAVCSISSTFISNVYSIETMQSHSSMIQQRCIDNSCATTTCFNNNPCQTVTGPSPNRSSSSFSSSPDDVEEGDDSGSLFGDSLPS
jgi:hypothetical protein